MPGSSPNSPVSPNLPSPTARLKKEDLRKIADLDALKAELHEYRVLCPDIETLRIWKDQAAQFPSLVKEKKAALDEIKELQSVVEEKERQRLDALERERAIATRYKELDVFKLDVMARELRSRDEEVGQIMKTAKGLQQDAGRLRNHIEQQKILPHGEKILEQCRDLRSHIRDIIQECLNETQKMHIGIALADRLAANALKENGGLAGHVVERDEEGREIRAWSAGSGTSSLA